MIYIAGDHHATNVLSWVEEKLQSLSLPFKNISSDEPLTSLIVKLCTNILADNSAKGIIVCGTGVAVEIGCNRFDGIRASLVSSPTGARRAVEFDNANVLCLAGWNEIDREQPTSENERTHIHAIIDAFLNTKFDGNEKRSEMLRALDEINSRTVN